MQTYIYILLIAVLYIREAFDSLNNWTALINNINNITTGDEKLASSNLGKRYFPPDEPDTFNRLPNGVQRQLNGLPVVFAFRCRQGQRAKIDCLCPKIRPRSWGNQINTSLFQTGPSIFVYKPAVSKLFEHVSLSKCKYYLLSDQRHYGMCYNDSLMLSRLSK